MNAQMNKSDVHQSFEKTGVCERSIPRIRLNMWIVYQDDSTVTMNEKPPRRGEVASYLFPRWDAR